MAALPRVGRRWKRTSTWLADVSRERSRHDSCLTPLRHSPGDLYLVVAPDGASFVRLPSGTGPHQAQVMPTPNGRGTVGPTGGSDEDSKLAASPVARLQEGPAQAWEGVLTRCRRHHDFEVPKRLRGAV